MSLVGSASSGAAPHALQLSYRRRMGPTSFLCLDVNSSLGEQASREAIRQLVEGHAPVVAEGDDASLTQLAKLVRCRRDRQANNVGDVADTQLFATASERRQDPDARRVGEDCEQLRNRGNRGIARRVALQPSNKLGLEAGDVTEIRLDSAHT